jgi:uncharacterized protein YkwD
MMMRTVFCLCVLMTFPPLAFGQDKKGGKLPITPPPSDARWSPLFNGKDLSGWKGLKGVWRLENGEIIGAFPDGQKPFTTFLCSDKEYVDFELEFEVKLVGGPVNSGFQFRTIKANPEKFTTRGPQVEITDAGLNAPVGSLVTEPAGMPWILSNREAAEKVFKKDEFNRFQLAVSGKHVTITLNGLKTVDGDFEMLNKGILGFQIHGAKPGKEVRFRNARIHVLSDKATPIAFTPLKAPPGTDLLPQELEVLNLINEYRAKNGLPAHKINAALCRASRKHSANMASKNKLDHVLDGKGPGDRAVAEGFKGFMSENCAGGGKDTPRSFFELWVGSLAHRSNMLGFRAGEMGVGFGRTQNGEVDFYTAMFGASP